MQEAEGRATALVPATLRAGEVSWTAGITHLWRYQQSCPGCSKGRLPSRPGTGGLDSGLDGAVSLNPEQQEAPTQYYRKHDGVEGAERDGEDWRLVQKNITFF